MYAGIKNVKKISFPTSLKFYVFFCLFVWIHSQKKYPKSNSCNQDLKLNKNQRYNRYVFATGLELIGLHF